MTPLFDSRFTGTPKRTSVTVLSRVAGAAIFLALIWSVTLDARRPLAVRELTERANRIVNGRVNSIASMLTGGPSAPTSGGWAPSGGAGGSGGASDLAAGVAATVAPYLLPARRAGRSTPVEGAVYQLTSFEVKDAPGALPLRTATRLAGTLVTHTEKRRVSVYLLDVARSDRLLGPFLMRSPIDCENLAPVPAVQPIPPELPIHRFKGQPPICDGVTATGMLSVNSATIADIADYIADEVGTVVIDRTGILGRFNATLRWDASRRAGPSVFKAVEDQLGLKLLATTQETDVLVVDKVEGLTSKLKRN